MPSPVSRPRLVGAVVLLLLVACQRPEARVDPTRTYFHPGVGVLFELPADWTETAEGSAVVFGGPAGTPAFFTTLTLQASPELGVEADVPGELERVLTAAIRALPSDEPPRLRPAQLLVLPSQAPLPLLGLRYGLTFDLYERQRLREGLIVRTPTALFSLYYSAPAELFARSYLVFDDAVSSLLTGPPDGGQP